MAATISYPSTSFKKKSLTRGEKEWNALGNYLKFLKQQSVTNTCVVSSSPAANVIAEQLTFTCVIFIAHAVMKKVFKTKTFLIPTAR